MVDHQIIQWPVIEYKLNIFKELQGDGGIYGVDQGGLSVQHERRVVGYAAGDGKQVLEQSQPAVCSTYPAHEIG